MGVVQSAGDLRAKPDRCLRGQSAGGDLCGKQFPLNELHREVGDALPFVYFVNVADVGMIERGYIARFAGELRASLGV